MKRLNESILVRKKIHDVVGEFGRAGRGQGEGGERGEMGFGVEL